MFSTFKFACHGYLQKKRIVHIQCLLRVDGSIVAGVFLTSFFCVVPESLYSSDTASSSLLVAWYSNCFSAASSTATHRQTVAVMCLTTQYYVFNRIVVHMK